MAKQQENRGGARANSGRKPIFGISEREMKKLLAAIRKKAREQGSSWETQFAEHLFSEDWREAAAFFKMFTDKLFVKATQSEHDVSQPQGPGIFLPEQRPDPGKDAEVVKLQAQK